MCNVYVATSGHQNEFLNRGESIRCMSLPSYYLMVFIAVTQSIFTDCCCTKRLCVYLCVPYDSYSEQ